MSRHVLRIAQCRNRSGRGLALVAVAALACARPPSQEPVPETGSAAWVGSTCFIEFPDTTGWPRHRFAGLSISVPREYTVSGLTARSVRFHRGTGSLSLSISTAERSMGLYARPARPQNEASCFLSLGGYAADIASSAYGHDLEVTAEWDGHHFWPADDWRRRLIARITASRVHDATVLRQALRTIRADRDVGS